MQTHPAAIFFGFVLSLIVLQCYFMDATLGVFLLPSHLRPGPLMPVTLGHFSWPFFLANDSSSPSCQKTEGFGKVGWMDEWIEFYFLFLNMETALSSSAISEEL